jgi:anti-sigma factor RsiW
MMTSRHFTNEELTAYLDQEIDSVTADLISRRLETDAVLQGRVAKLNTMTDEILAAFDGLLGLAPAVPDMGDDVTPSKAKSWIVPVGFAAALVLAAVFGRYGLQRPDAKGWMDYVSAYQALYVNGTLASIGVSAADNTTQLAQLSKILGRDLSLVQNTGGIALRRAQLLGFEGRPLVQMAFLSQIGAPIALCVIKSETAKEQTFQFMTFEGMSAAYWTKEGYSFLLIGGQDDRLIEQEAKLFFDLI